MQHGYMHICIRVKDQDHINIQLLESACSLVRPSVTKEPRIIDTYIRVKDHGYTHRSYPHHTHMHHDQGSYMYASWIEKYMHQGQGSRIIDVSIIIRVRDNRYMHHTHKYHTHMHHDQGSYMYGYKNICIRVKDQES